MIRNLKKLRAQKGVSQKQLGEIIGVSQQSINKYENYDIEPDISTLILMARYFHTSVDFLIGNTDIPQVIERTSAFNLNEEEANLINGFRELTKSEKESLFLIVENYLKNKK